MIRGARRSRRPELAAGSKTVRPRATTTYLLTADGDAGTASALATVSTVGTFTGITATLVADPVLITAGESTTLTWSTTNAASVSIDQGVGALTPLAGGSRSVMPTESTTYTLTAVGEGGSVTVMPGITATLVADPFQITSGRDGDVAVDHERRHERRDRPGDRGGDAAGERQRQRFAHRKHHLYPERHGGCRHGPPPPPTSTQPHPRSPLVR